MCTLQSWLESCLVRVGTPLLQATAMNRVWFGREPLLTNHVWFGQATPSSTLSRGSRGSPLGSKGSPLMSLNRAPLGGYVCMQLCVYI